MKKCFVLVFIIFTSKFLSAQYVLYAINKNNNDSTQFLFNKNITVLCNQKIAVGNLYSVLDSSIILKNKDGLLDTVFVNDIEVIKTKIQKKLQRNIGKVLIGIGLWTGKSAITSTLWRYIFTENENYTLPIIYASTSIVTLTAGSILTFEKQEFNIKQYNFLCLKK